MHRRSLSPDPQEAAERRVEDFRAALGPFVVAAVTTHMAMIFTDAQSGGNPVVFANDSFLALTGFSRDVVLGRHLTSLLADVTDRDARASITAALAAGTKGDWELRCRRADRGEFLAAISLSPVRDEHGVVRQHFLSFVDLGDPPAGSRTRRDELHALYEKAPGFIATWHGPEHRFTFANPAYERLVGRGGLTGLTVAEALPGLVGQQFLALLDDVYQTGTPFVGAEMPVAVSDADDRPRRRFVSFVYQPVRAADGGISGLFCEGFDVTEQKLARDEVLTLQADLIHLFGVSAMETLATMLAHELNQPLAAVVNYTAGARRLIQADAVGPDQLLDVLRLIDESAERAGEIIRHLRSLTDRETPFRSVFDLQEAIGRCIRLVKLGGCEDVHIADASAEGVVLEADPIQIQQVIINLLRNACDASTQAGNHAVGIATSLSGDTVTVTVTDSGAGVPADIVRAGFRWTPSHKSNGMGVGLSIARTIVDAHDGMLWLRSSGAGGSSFAFSLPRAGKAR